MPGVAEAGDCVMDSHLPSGSSILSQYMYAAYMLACSYTSYVLYGTTTPDWRTRPHRNVSESRGVSLVSYPIFMSNHGTIRDRTGHA